MDQCEVSYALNISSKLLSVYSGLRSTNGIISDKLNKLNVYSVLKKRNYKNKTKLKKTLGVIYKK